MGNNTPEGTFDYDVTEGGVLVYFGPENGLDLTTPSENPIEQRANVERVIRVLRMFAANPDSTGVLDLVENAPEPALLEALAANADEVIAELERYAREIGKPCRACGGEGGQESGRDGLDWTVCTACAGTRVGESAA
jgi:hypothetical protein